MVDRSGFYINGDKICRADVKIDWNLGFDKLAKEAYVAELITALSKVCLGMDIAEVTSASPNEYTRMLSPIFIEYRGGTSMEDYYQFINKDYMALRLGIDKSFVFPHFYCSNAVHMLPLIRLFDVFTDVFYNPTKPGGTQAEACAILKLLDKENNLTILSNPPLFQKWCLERMAYRR